MSPTPCSKSWSQYRNLSCLGVITVMGKVTAFIIMRTCSSQCGVDVRANYSGEFCSAQLAYKSVEGSEPCALSGRHP